MPLSTRFRVRVPVAPKLWGHSSMVEHEVSSKPCRRTLIIATKVTEETVKDTYEP